MATGLGESEFGGKDTKTGVQPLPHVPTPSEQLMLIYRTGDPSGQSPADPMVIVGLRPEDVQRAVRTAEGAFAKGEVADELLTQADAIISELSQESAVETV